MSKISSYDKLIGVSAPKYPAQCAKKDCLYLELNKEQSKYFNTLQLINIHDRSLHSVELDEKRHDYRLI